MSPEYALKHIFSGDGRPQLHDRRQIEGLLRDHCQTADCQREIRVLMLALDVKIPTDLLASLPLDAVVIGRMVQRLYDFAYLPEHVA